MELFYSDKKELRSGWKILRVFIFFIILTAFFAVLLSLLKVDVHGKYAVFLAAIASVLLELWLSRKPLSFIGLNLKDKVLWKDLFVGMVWGGLSIVLAAGGMLFITSEMNISQIGQGIAIANLASVLFFYLMVALGEEILFRGYILSALKGHVGVKVRVVISAGIFSAIHLINPDYYWFAFIYAFLIGLMFGLIVIKRGNLGCVIGFHFLWNLLQEKGWLNMPDRGGEAVFMIVLLINLGLVYWFLPGRSIDAG